MTGTPGTTDAGAVARHRALLARSLRQAADALGSIGVLVALTVAVTLSCVGVGLPLLRAVIGLQRRHAGRQRALASEVLEEPVPAPYRPVPERGLLAQLDAVRKDPATWRDLAWLGVDGVAGLTVALLTPALWLAVVWHAVLPGVLWAFFPPLRGLLAYAGMFLDGTSPAGYVVVPLLGVGCVWLTLRVDGPLVQAHARLARYWLGPRPGPALARRVDELTRTRADSLGMHAAEIRRIERDLHDGAQARLVALGMSLGMAEAALAGHPEAVGLLAEARQNNLLALAELRDLVHGIRPPVLADRGLGGAIRALALSSGGPVDVDVDLAGRPPAPAESAAYFAVAECVTNAIKHARASRIGVAGWHRDGLLVLVVSDDGVGGADPEAGSGLAGVRRRLAAFDGSLTVTSPVGGPTTVTVEVPCELSSPRT